MELQLSKLILSKKPIKVGGDRPIMLMQLAASVSSMMYNLGGNELFGTLEGTLSIVSNDM